MTFTMELRNLMFMSSKNLLKCIKDITLKNTEGYDRIPQRIIVDGKRNLIVPLSHLFELIYNTKCIPKQRKFSNKCIKNQHENEIYTQEGLG